MTVELRKVAYNAHLSQETHAFSAAVFIDGVKAGDVENDGHGGAHRWYPHTLEARLKAHTDTLPPVELGHGLIVACDPELFVNGLLERYLTARDLKRLLSKYVVTIEDRNGKPVVLRSGAFLSNVLPMAIRQMVERHPDAIILNRLSFKDALDLYVHPEGR